MEKGEIIWNTAPDNYSCFCFFMVVLLITCFKFYICVYLKRLESVFVNCFITIPVLFYHVYNCSSAWFRLWTIYMRVLCISLLYNNFFVHMRFSVTCSSTWYVRAYRQLWFLIFSALVLFLQLSWWPSALWIVHTCSNYFNRWRLMNLLVEVLS